MDRHGERLALRELRRSAVEGVAHGIWRMRRDAEAHTVRGKPREVRDRTRQLGEARAAFRGVGPEYFLIIDSPSAEPRQRVERRSGAPGVRDARDAGGPRVAYALLGGLEKFFGRGVVFQRADRADPGGECGFAIFHGEVGQLEVRVAVDQSRNEGAVREFEPTSSLRCGHGRRRAHRRDLPALVNENGAVCDGRRRDWMHGAGTDIKHAGSGVGCQVLGVRTPDTRRPSVTETPLSHQTAYAQDTPGSAPCPDRTSPNGGRPGDRTAWRGTRSTSPPRV